MNRTRSRHGSSITEFPAALLILFLIFFFPFIDILMLSLSYGMCWFLNLDISNQAARARGVDLQNVIDGEVAKINANGLANILNVKLASGDVVTDPKPNVTQAACACKGTPAVYGSLAQSTITVTTTFTVKPFLNIPFPMAVPGLNAAIPFSITSAQNREVSF